jgi:GAF domain-containing protein
VVVSQCSGVVAGGAADRRALQPGYCFDDNACALAALTDFVTQILERLGVAPTAESLVGALVPEIADASRVFRRTSGRYDLIAWGHIEPAKGALLDDLATFHHPSADDPRDPIAHVGRLGKGVLVTWVTRRNIERATDDKRVHAIFDAFGPRNIAVVPIRNGDYVFVAAISETPRKFIEDDLEFLMQLATRLAAVLP